MYILSFEEMLDYLDQIIHTIESNESAFGSVVTEVAYQLRDELVIVASD